MLKIIDRSTPTQLIGVSYASGLVILFFIKRSKHGGGGIVGGWMVDGGDGGVAL